MRILSVRLSVRPSVCHTHGLYRAHHSTETAVLKVLSDILLALDTLNLAMLTLLDLSAAFDSVDHHTLLQRLQTSYGLGGQVMNWFASYLHGRVQHVRFSATSSTPSAVWSTTRLSFRPNSLPTLHCRFAAAYQVPPAHATCLRGRHSNLRVLPAA